MPNHWESSARPLFVKTVFVNGNRHAILSQEDPLLRLGNSSSKKQSRANSPLSPSSGSSISGSDSQESSTECRIRSSKLGKAHPSQSKDMSSDLQSCCRLIKLRLTSGVRERKIKSRTDSFLDNSQEEKEGDQNLEGGVSKQKRKKMNRNKSCRKSEGEGSQNENTITEYKNGRDRRYYIYNFENNNRKKNYCFVKISSHPSQFLLNCSCDNVCGSDHSSSFDKQNLVISATFHNLIMAPEKKENLLKNSNYVFSFGDSDSRDLWSNYLGRSYYNSLTERVLQWLDMSNKQKRRTEKPFNKDATPNNTERIFAGETFLNENYKARIIREDVNKLSDKLSITKENETGDVETEVKGEANIETILSKEKSKNSPGRSLDEMSADAASKESPIESEQQQMIQRKQNSELTSNSSSVCLKQSVENHLNNSISNLSKSSIDLLFTRRWGDQFNKHSKRRVQKEKRNVLTRQSQHVEVSEEEIDEDNFQTMSATYWEKRLHRKSDFEKKLERYNKMTMSHDGAQDGFKTQIFTQEFTGRNQKSINNLNITRRRPVFNQNLWSPQQQNISRLGEGKVVRLSEKDPGRPQLHIFMPSIPMKDSSEESMSECESFLGELG